MKTVYKLHKEITAFQKKHKIKNYAKAKAKWQDEKPVTVKRKRKPKKEKTEPAAKKAAPKKAAPVVHLDKEDLTKVTPPPIKELLEQ